jgi:hypothetical protein
MSKGFKDGTQGDRGTAFLGLAEVGHHKHTTHHSFHMVRYRGTRTRVVSTELSVDGAAVTTGIQSYLRESIRQALNGPLRFEMIWPDSQQKNKPIQEIP